MKNQTSFQKGHKPLKGCFGKGSKHTEEYKIRMSLLKKGKPSGRKGIKTNLPAWNRGLHKRLNTGRTCFKSEDLIGEKHWNWKGGMPKCKVCDKILSFKKGIYCRKHRFELMRGINSPRWIGDEQRLINRYQTSKERMNTLYVRWKNSCLRRDNYKCKINNCDCKGHLEVHHILGYKDHPELRYDINNGITLCHFHHPRVREEEKRMIPTFKELLSVSKV